MEVYRIDDLEGCKDPTEQNPYEQNITEKYNGVEWSKFDKIEHY